MAWLGFFFWPRLLLKSPECRLQRSGFELEQGMSAEGPEAGVQLAQSPELTVGR